MFWLQLPVDSQSLRRAKGKNAEEDILKGRLKTMEEKIMQYAAETVQYNVERSVLATRVPNTKSSRGLSKADRSHDSLEKAGAKKELKS